LRHLHLTGRSRPNGIRFLWILAKASGKIEIGAPDLVAR
jgi:hypothetical protein